MRIVAVPTELARLRGAIRNTHSDLGSSHLAEAFARGLGFATNAAFLAWDRQRPRNEIPVRDFDASAAAKRFVELGNTRMTAGLIETLIDVRAGQADGISYDMAVAMGIDAARHHQLPESFDARVGYLAHLLHRRVNGGSGFASFMRDDAQIGFRNHHFALVEAIRDAASIDPPIAAFLSDCLTAAEDVRVLYRQPGIFGPLWWRDLTYKAYAPRIGAFFETMCLRSPYAFRQAVLDGWTAPAPKLTRPEEVAAPELTLDLGPSLTAGIFDAGRASPDQDTLVGAGCMALWRAGYVDDAIQGFVEEAAANPAAALTRKFGVACRNVERLKSFLVHPIDGLTQGAPPESVGLVLVREDQAELVRSRAERSEWTFQKVASDGAAALLTDGAPRVPDVCWITAQDGLSESEVWAVAEIAYRTTAIVTGVGPDTWERLRSIAGAHGVKSAAAFDASAAPGPLARREDTSEGRPVKTFAELQAADRVEAQDLKDTLRDYAVSGAVISTEVVRRLIDRTALDPDDVEHLKHSCSIGNDRQHELRRRPEGMAYLQISLTLTGLSFGPPVSGPRP